MSITSDTILSQDFQCPACGEKSYIDATRGLCMSCGYDGSMQDAFKAIAVPATGYDLSVFLTASAMGKVSYNISSGGAKLVSGVYNYSSGSKSIVLTNLKTTSLSLSVFVDGVKSKVTIAGSGTSTLSSINMNAKHSVEISKWEQI